MLRARHKTALSALEARVSELVYADRKEEMRAHEDYSARIQQGIDEFNSSLEKPDHWDGCDCRYERRY